MDDENTVYQWRRKYVRKNQSNLVPTLTANMGEGQTQCTTNKNKVWYKKINTNRMFLCTGLSKIL